MYEAVIRVFYPLDRGRIVLRTEKDWNKDIEALSVDNTSHCHSFRICHSQAVLCYKPCIRDGNELIWAAGVNRLALMRPAGSTDIYPHFFSPPGGTITDIIGIPSAIYRRERLIRLYLPEGYSENPLKRYPVLYMHDGKNLFFPEEAFLGQEWHIDENLNLMDRMNLTEQLIVVGIYAENREKEYTRPGYEQYGRSIVNEIKPWLDNNYRTLAGPWNSCVIGSSLGGVVSFYLAWEYPHIFGLAACLSSTFSWKDNFLERVEKDPFEPRAHLALYMDSGWPGDNYDPTMKLAAALLERGYHMGRNFMHLAYPLADHSEYSWAHRIHIPIQLVFGRLRRVQMRTLHPELAMPCNEAESSRRRQKTVQ